jgi:hypothetical protein
MWATSRLDPFWGGHFLSCRYDRFHVRVRRWWWRLRWPHACAGCRGAGGVAFAGTYHEPPDFEFCGMLDVTTCHRCGRNGLNEDSEGPCTYCDWNYDDAEPEPIEGECWDACGQTQIDRAQARGDY